MGDESRRSSRRNILKTTALTAGLGVVPGAMARSDSSNRPPQLDDFTIVGTKEIKTSFSPDSITVETTYKSQELAKRYGTTPPQSTETKTHERDDPSDDRFPEHGVEIERERWETKYAKEDEWAAYHRNRRSNGGGVSTQHSHDPEEEHHCGIGKWNYKKHDDGGYSIKSPINLLCYGFDISDVGDVLDGVGWTNDVNEHDRYAWDVDRETFSGPGQQPHGEYGSWVESKYRPMGGFHARCYELEDGIVSIQAHEDDTLYDGHSVESYQSAEDEVYSIFLDESDVSGHGIIVLDNDKKDHGGSASILKSSRDTINQSC